LIPDDEINAHSPPDPDTAPVVTISTDDSLLDLDLVHRWLSEDAYWSLGRPREVFERSLAGSVNLGAYDGVDATIRQVGFLRIVTDRATFAWVCDVYVDPAARGASVGKALMAECDRLLTSYGVRRALLATADAHGLYAQYGFAPMSDPVRWMERTYEQ
jgi:GNAT superfamily N-acetyltransferase